MLVNISLKTPKWIHVKLCMNRGGAEDTQEQKMVWNSSNLFDDILST